MTKGNSESSAEKDKNSEANAEKAKNSESSAEKDKKSESSAEKAKNSESSAEKVKDSGAFGKAKNRAEDYASDPDKLNDLVDKAMKKANGKKGKLSAVWTQLMACFRLFKAYARGSYREIPWQSLVMLVASVIYFVMPIDLIPDFILGLGFLDDATLLGWTFTSFSSDIDAFVDWESSNVT